jgi:hypothetical protein
MTIPSPLPPHSAPSQTPAALSPGAIRLDLYVPVALHGGGRVLSSVTIAPAKFDHIMRWDEGKIDGAHALLLELTGLGETELRAMAVPDSSRLMAIFVASLPDQLRKSMAEGAPPRAAEQLAARQPQNMPLFDGGGDGGEDSGIDFGERNARRQP